MTPSCRAAQKVTLSRRQQAEGRSREADGGFESWEADGVRVAWLAGGAHPADEPEGIR